MFLSSGIILKVIITIRSKIYKEPEDFLQKYRTGEFHMKCSRTDRFVKDSGLFEISSN